MDIVSRLVAITRQRATKLWGRIQEDRGEGVVSVAIAILIITLIGVGLWVAADRWFESLEGSVDEQIEQIGD